jgi:serine/threonine protein kinase
MRATGAGDSTAGTGDSSTGDGLLPPAPRWPSSSCSTAFIPRILPHRSRKPSKSDVGLAGGPTAVEFNAEPTGVWSMSFMGTYEYLAPEIIRGEGHVSVIDLWTL